LITASILSKKLAAGLQGLVLDVKTGSGAFMAEADDARALARSLVDVANGADLKTTAVITDMNEPLASAAGNALEVQNAVDFLTGARRDPRLESVVLALASEMLVLGGLAVDADQAAEAARSALEDGRAAERFQAMVTALGGPADFIEKAAAYLPEALVIRSVTPDRAGTITAIDTRAVGLAVVALGGGRLRPQDTIDHTVGFSDLAGIGGKVGPDQPLAMVHARTDDAADRAADALRAAYQLDGTPGERPVIIERMA